MRKFNFNMVEIALAMVIIAIGISCILGLFSVGVNARKAAISENNIADAAEYILGLYRAVIVEKYNEEYEESNGSETTKIKLITSLPDGNVLDPGSHNNSGSPVPDMSTNVDISSLTGAISSHIYTVSGNSMSNFNIATATKLPEAFVYAPSRVVDFGEGENTSAARIADCEIVGSIWKAPIPVSFQAGVTGSETSSVEMPYSYGVRIYLELSWPITQLYQKRDKKVFVMDVVNPKPVLAAKSAAQ